MAAPLQGRRPRRPRASRRSAGDGGAGARLQPAGRAGHRAAGGRAQPGRRPVAPAADAGDGIAPRRRGRRRTPRPRRGSRSTSPISSEDRLDRARRPAPSPADPAVLVRGGGRGSRADGVLAALAEDQGRPLQVEVAAGPLRVPLDAGGLSDVLDVLVDNVFAHTADAMGFRVSLGGAARGCVCRWPTMVPVCCRRRRRATARQQRARPPDRAADGGRVRWRGRHPVRAPALGVVVKVRMPAAMPGEASQHRQSSPGSEPR